MARPYIITEAVMIPLAEFSSIWCPRTGKPCFILRFYHSFEAMPVGGMDEHGIQATLGLLHASTGRSISFLGHTEFQDLACPSDWASLKILGESPVQDCRCKEEDFVPCILACRESIHHLGVSLASCYAQSKA